MLQDTNREAQWFREEERSGRLIPFLEVAQPEAFPPIRQEKANGWGTDLVLVHTVGYLAGMR